MCCFFLLTYLWVLDHNSKASIIRETVNLLTNFEKSIGIIHPAILPIVIGLQYITDGSRCLLELSYNRNDCCRGTTKVI